MKTVLLLFILLGTALTTKAQLLGGIFSQNKTQVKYMLEQIAALKVYATYLNKGYDIIKDGTGFISDVKNGEFSLHKDYFHSLSTVSPTVKKYPKAAAILAMQSEMDQASTGPMLAALRPGQAAELKRILSAVRSASVFELDELLLVLGDDNIEMTEDARIKAIDRIYIKVQQLYTFHKQLLKSTAGYIQAGKRQSLDDALYRKLY